MTNEKMLRYKRLSRVMLIIAIILFLAGIGVLFGPKLLYEAELNQTNHEYEELVNQNLPGADGGQLMDPNDLSDTDQVETATDSKTDEETNETVEQIAQPDGDTEPVLPHDTNSNGTAPSPPSERIDDQSDLSGADSSESSSGNSPIASGTATVSTGNTGADLAALRAQNRDFAAWLQIPGTNVDYPVVRSDDTDYYLTHTFNGTKSSLGTLFSLGKTSYSKPSKNIAIYGHHISGSGQKMFKPLLSYKSSSFWDEHQIIYLDSPHATATYKAFAVVNLENDDWDPSTADFASDDEFLAFVSRAREQALYDTGVSVSASDYILTLITCDRSYAGKDGRLIVMAVKQ